MFSTAKKAFTQIGPARLSKMIITVLVLIGIGYWANSLDFEGWAKWFNFNNSENALWYQGPIGFFLLGVALTSVGGPRQVVAFFAAYFFGVWQGLIISMAAVVTSCLVIFLIARIFEAASRNIIRGKVDYAFKLWRENPFSTTLIVRLLPVGSNILTNMAAGATGVPMLAFIVASAIGYVPQMAVFGLMGSGVEVGAEGQIALSVVLFIILMIFSLWIYGRYRKKLRKHQSRQQA